MKISVDLGDQIKAADALNKLLHANGIKLIKFKNVRRTMGKSPYLVLAQILSEAAG